ncbi:molybdopterin synthase, small subunit CNX7 [Kickxella alabastrina]|uniref:molybdopterin synthase, small subunit CNX7 n=1 Tax=Kickxella alabastrina TaxID=61397 RepID=UPI00221E5B02|nr:molybdopterin synthase, small subunit CNX7 [Kickxella alabastrina]KAI7825521.1 molybdopterin synthase, small subunit CNX7 [Kickxella alabastrina]
MISIKLLYFASARDAAHGLSSETIELEQQAPATLQSAVNIIRQRHPNMEAVLKTALLSLNQEYCEAENTQDILLRDGDEVAVIPPVSGG